MRISVLNLMALLMWFGRAAELGWFAGLSLWVVFIPLFADFALGVFIRLGYLDRIIARIETKAKIRELNRIVNREKKSNV